MTAPAPFSRLTATASSSGIQPSKAWTPQVVGRPATLKDSLTVIGTPSSGARSPRFSCGVGLAGGGEGAVEVAHHHGVDRGVQRLDPGDRRLGELDRAHLSDR